MNKYFWKNKNVLITGYEGFLGSNFVKILLTTGAKITGLDISAHRKDSLLTKTEREKINCIKGSIENYELLKEIMSNCKIEHVFHLAAEALIGKCLENPIKAFSINVQGTLNILESCRNAKTIKSVVIASSDKAYGSHEHLPYRENDPLLGNHPYDVSKSCADMIARTYYHTYGLPVSITRCGNIYGPGDLNFSRIIPDAIKSIILNKTFLIRSDGKFTRDYVFVEDIVEGYILIAEKMRKLKLAGEAFNFSNENPINVINLVKMIYKIFNKKSDYKVLNQAKYEIKHQYLSAAKARKILGWKSKYNLNAGLKKTIDWYKLLFKIS